MSVIVRTLCLLESCVPVVVSVACVIIRDTFHLLPQQGREPFRINPQSHKTSMSVRHLHTPHHSAPHRTTPHHTTPLNTHPQHLPQHPLHSTPLLSSPHLTTHYHTSPQSPSHHRIVHNAHHAARTTHHRPHPHLHPHHKPHITHTCANTRTRPHGQTTWMCGVSRSDVTTCSHTCSVSQPREQSEFRASLTPIDVRVPVTRPISCKETRS